MIEATLSILLDGDSFIRPKYLLPAVPNVGMRVQFSYADLIVRCVKWVDMYPERPIQHLVVICQPFYELSDEAEVELAEQFLQKGWVREF